MSKKTLIIVLILVFILGLFGCREEVPEDMVVVEAGTTGEANGNLTVEEDFYIGKYHVTQAEFEEVMGFNPSDFVEKYHENLIGENENRPVEQVTWYDAVMYCNKLSEREGLDKYYNISDIEYNNNRIDSANVTRNKKANGYRLPTKDEWEYAARGGKNGKPTTYAGSDNIDEVGWYMQNSEVANSNRITKIGTMPVGEKDANEPGIYDMSGNVWDWTDTAKGSERVYRGGSWRYHPSRCEVSKFDTYEPSYSLFNIGFRIARSPGR